MANKVDEQYLSLLKDIINNGTKKDTRAGEVKSVFGRMMRFNLKEGLPLLTTKKVFTKGVIHELLWFLHGETNIKYLVENNVHIWDGDAYRYYTSLLTEHNRLLVKACRDDLFCYDEYVLKDEESFLEAVKSGLKCKFYTDDFRTVIDYTFGDLGPVYGRQWRCFGEKGIDQIQNIIDTLKTNPDDRRMLCIAFNPDVLDKVALPPCHVMFQFYTRELENGKRELSCMWSQRSVDVGLGWPFNLLSYSLLTHIIAEICGMEVGEIICSLGDCHIYLNQLDGINEQLSRDPHKYELPKLSFTRKINSIDDLRYEDFLIENYQSYGKISLPLSVG